MPDVTCHRNLESAYLTMPPRYSVTEFSGRQREREKGGLKLLYQLMEKYKHFSNPNLNKPISSFFASWLNRTWRYRRFLMQYLISNIEGADSSYALARWVSVVDAVNWAKRNVILLQTLPSILKMEA
jgi:hypothetical protein